MNDLSGRNLQRYRLWLADGEEVNAVTMKNMMSGFRAFLKWAGTVEPVPENLYSKLMIPRVRRSQQSSEDILETERSEELLTHLSRYGYASMHHVLLALLWETGMRIGAANSLDLSDVDFDEERIELIHRSAQDATLKNGKNGERLIALSTELTEMLEDHVDTFRFDVTDAEERLSRAENVDAVTIDEFYSLDPKLSATIITVGITLRWTATMTDAKVRGRLAEVPGLESIERIR